MEKATTDYVDEALPILKETYKGSTRAEQQALLAHLPKSIDAAIVNDIEKALEDPIAKLSKVHKDPNPELVDFLTKINNNEKLDYPDYYYIVKKGKHKGKYFARYLYDEDENDEYEEICFDVDLDKKIDECRAIS